MESGFEDDFAPMQSSAGKTATIDDDSLILGDEDDSPKKTSEGKIIFRAKAFASLFKYLQTIVIPSFVRVSLVNIAILFWDNEHIIYQSETAARFYNL